MMKSMLLSATTVLLMASAAFAQQKETAFTMPAASPKSTVIQQFSTSNIKVEYNRPGVKGRQIFGNVVPFGKPWRTGANMITKVTFEEEVIIEGKKLAAGTYALYTIPNKESWTIVFNTNADSPGLSKIEAEKDVLKVDVKPIATKESYETFTIDVNTITNTTAVLALKWENTIVPIKIVAENKDRILEYLTTALQGENPPYRDAAYFFYDNDYKLEEVLNFADKVLEKRPDAYWMVSHKANTFNKLGKKKEAIELATKALEMTKGTDMEAEYKARLDALNKK